MFERPVPYYIDESGQKRFFLDPTQPISIDFCMECWSFLPEGSCICEICGNKSGNLVTDGRKACRLCGESLGEREAKEYPPGPFMPIPSYECFDCLDKIERTKKSFELIANSGNCKRHRDQLTIYSCGECGEGICQFCTYYVVKGFFRKKVVEQPLCFFCVRRKLQGGGASAAILHIYRDQVAEKGYRFQ